MRNLLLCELTLSELIIRDGLEVLPRFLVQSAEGTYLVLAPQLDNRSERRRALQRIAAFMAWKLARIFVMAAQIEKPDAIVAFAVNPEGCEGVLQKIDRDPIGFGTPRWLDGAVLDPDVAALLPGREMVLDAETLRDIERAFVPGGEFETWRVNWGSAESDAAGCAWSASRSPR